MSIINLEKTFENNILIYCSLNNKFIIECICLNKLFIPEYGNDKPEKNNENFSIFTCSKVKIITIYDIYKNIISKPIQTDLFKKPIKIGKILKKINEKDIYFFKTFLGAFLENNKLNDIKYDIRENGTIYKILYNNITFLSYYFIKIYSINYNKKNT